MPWAYTIDTKRDVLLGTATGILTGEELKAGVHRATHDPNFHPDMRIFLDYCAVVKFGFSVDTMEVMADHQVYSSKSRRAFLVTTGFAVSIFQMYQSMVTAGLVQVFTDRTAALAWLNEGMPPEKYLP